LGTLLNLLDSLLAKPNSEIWNLVRNIIFTLGSLGPEGKPAVSRLTKIMIDVRYAADIRTNAAEALGKIGHSTPEVLESLRIASESSDVSVNKAAQNSLATITRKTEIQPK